MGALLYGLIPPVTVVVLVGGAELCDRVEARHRQRRYVAGLVIATNRGDGPIKEP